MSSVLFISILIITVASHQGIKLSVILLLRAGEAPFDPTLVAPTKPDGDEASDWVLHT
jgi:hypothetical protein